MPARRSPVTGLTAKQEAFCRAYVEMNNASDAYRAAYDAQNMQPQTIHRKAMAVMKEAPVVAMIESLRAKVAAVAEKKLEINKEWVLAELVENVKMAKSAEPVLDHEGNPTGEYKVNIAAANRSLELIGKEIGMFVDRKDVTHRHANLDDETLEDEIGRLEREIATFGGAEKGKAAPTKH